MSFVNPGMSMSNLHMSVGNLHMPIGNRSMSEDNLGMSISNPAMSMIVQKSSCPAFPVQITVIDGFGYMIGKNWFGIFQISNGSSHFNDAVVSTG